MDPCRIVVLAEDSIAGGHAMERCGRIVAQLEGEIAFAVQPYRFVELSDPASAHNASEVAARADVLVFAVHGAELSHDFQRWLDALLDRRTRSDGALALMIIGPIESHELVDVLVGRFHEVALRLGLEFLPLLPDALPEGASGARTSPVPPGLPSEFRDRGNTHWGLNE
jgi:hypothetical protein